VKKVFINKIGIRAATDVFISDALD